MNEESHKDLTRVNFGVFSDKQRELVNKMVYASIVAKELRKIISPNDLISLNKEEE